MSHGLFPERIETERLVLDRMGVAETDYFEFYDLVRREDWEASTAEMPWFRLENLGEVAEFVEVVDEQWRGRERARYLLRAKEEAGEVVGTASLLPEWDEKRAGSDIVLAKEYWGRGYGTERACAFVELAFEVLDLDAYYTTCAAGNERSKRMIESYVERYGGRHEGLLRQHSARPDGSVTDQHRFSIIREEYEAATESEETLACELAW